MGKKILKILVVSFLLTGTPISLPSLSAANPCDALPGKIDSQKKELQEMLRALQALNERFTESVKNDFNAQTEGVIDEIHRNEAIKIAFARKKLAKTIEKKRAELKALKVEYCPKCLPKENEVGLKLTCERCPEETRCRRLPATQ